MKKIRRAIQLFLSLLPLLQHVPTLAQSAPNRFTLVGTINRPTGTIQLLPVGGKKYHPTMTGTYQTTIVNGKFTFTGEAPYPLAFILLDSPDYVSNPFIVEAGTQSIQCNADSMREVPRVNNRSMRELQAAPVNFFAKLTLSTQRKREVLAFVKQHPSSYVGLWETVKSLSFGYDSLLDSTYLALAPTLKNTVTGVKLGKQLKSASIAAIVKPFPAVTLRTVDNRSAGLSQLQTARYTLIDFWFSRCRACIDQFPKLKTLFNTYSRTDQISIDKKAETTLWKKTIQQHELPWPQYLDEGGKFISGVLAIDNFPSNFLLDQQGRIIRKDVRLDELETFLTRNVPGPVR